MNVVLQLVEAEAEEEEEAVAIEQSHLKEREMLKSVIRSIRLLETFCLVLKKNNMETLQIKKAMASQEKRSQLLQEDKSRRFLTSSRTSELITTSF